MECTITCLANQLFRCLRCVCCVLYCWVHAVMCLALSPSMQALDLSDTQLIQQIEQKRWIDRCCGLVILVYIENSLGYWTVRLRRLCVTDYEQWCGLCRWQRNVVRLANPNNSWIDSFTRKIYIVNFMTKIVDLSLEIVPVGNPMS